VFHFEDSACSGRCAKSLFGLAGSSLASRLPHIYRQQRDSDFYWVQAFWLLIVSVIATAAWSLLDRKRDNYHVLNRYFRFFVRFGLAAQMFEYGMTKLIPTQFPSPSLNTLVTPVETCPCKACCGRRSVRPPVTKSSRMCRTPGRSPAHRSAHGPAGRDHLSRRYDAGLSPEYSYDIA